MNCLFEHNYAAGYGGAVSALQATAYDAYNLTIQSSVFRSNSAMQGGAVHTSTSTLIINSTFASNLAADGGNIYSNPSSNGLISLTGCTFEGSDDCGAMHSDIYCASGELMITESVFHGLKPVPLFSLLTSSSSSSSSPSLLLLLFLLFFYYFYYSYSSSSRFKNSDPYYTIVSASAICMHQHTAVL